VKRIIDGLYLLEASRYVNSYLIEGPSDLTLVDTGHSRSAEALIREIKGNGFFVRDIGRVIITHAHADHVGGAAALLERHPVKLFAHPKEIPILLGKELPRSGKGGITGFVMDFVNEHLLPWPAMEAVFPLEPGGAVRGMAQWQIMNTPGHTPGSISLFNPAKQVLICGDVIAHKRGRLELPPAAYNASNAALRRTVEELAKLDTDILCPGHGPVLRGGAFRYIEALVARRRTH